MEVYCVVTLSEVLDEVTVNLKGPICANSMTMKAKKLILVDDQYQTKHSIIEDSTAAP